MYSTSSSDLDAMAAGMSAFAGCFAIIALITVALHVWIFWRILTRAGFSGWLSLLNLVPFGTLALMLLLAFASWPSLTVPQAGYYPVAPVYTPPTPPAPPAYMPPSAPPAPPVPPTE